MNATGAGSCWTREALTSQSEPAGTPHRQENAGRVEASPLAVSITRSPGGRPRAALHGQPARRPRATRRGAARSLHFRRAGIRSNANTLIPEGRTDTGTIGTPSSRAGVDVLPVLTTAGTTLPITAVHGITRTRNPIDHRSGLHDRRSRGTDHGQKIGLGSGSILLGEEGSPILNRTKTTTAPTYNHRVHREIRRHAEGRHLDTTEASGRRETTTARINTEDHAPQIDVRRLLSLAERAETASPRRWMVEEDTMERPTVTILLSRCRLRFP